MTNVSAKFKPVAMDRLATLRVSTKLLLPGITFCLVVVLAANYITDHYGSPAILCALLLGMAFNNISKYPEFSHGLEFCGKTVLRCGVALLGVRITFSQITELGIQPVLVVFAVVAATLVFSLLIAKLLKIERIPAIIAGAGVAICGVSAALAVASVLPSNKDTEKNLLCTVVGITGLSTIVMVVYPGLMVSLGFSPEQVGLFLGASIHDVAQVFGAGHMISDEVGELATYTKMLRVSMLVPVVLGLGFIYRNAVLESLKMSATGQGVDSLKTPKPTIFPLFLVAFVVLVVLSNLSVIPAAPVEFMGDLSAVCLLVAMAALGTKTNLIEMWHVGRKPFLLLLLNTVFIGLLAYLLIQ
jgi:uncharacterized integral membrane protein (TIGR00698 family)